MCNRRFWLVNLALLLLYGWTLTEESANWWKCRRFFSDNTPWLDGRDLGDEENGRLLPYFPDYTPYRWRDGQLYPLD